MERQPAIGHARLQAYRFDVSESVSLS
jgi:hypothetical protein